MNTPEEIIDSLLPWLVERVTSDPYFAGVSVIHEDDSDALDKMSQALAILGGTAVIWMGPKGLDKVPNMRLGPMELQLTATVLQNPILGQNMKAGRSYARRLRDLCKHVRVPGLTSGLVPRENCIDRVDSDAAPVSYVIQFTTKEADAGPGCVSPVIFTVLNGVATLSCATALAEIWVSPASSYPRTGATGAYLYSGPITLTTSIQFCGYKTGLVPGPVDQIDYTAP